MTPIALAAPATPIHLDRVTLSNGITLHYATQGPHNGPAVVFLHGYSDSWFSFSRIMPLMPTELRLVAADMRGHGDSDRPPLGYGMHDLAGDVVRMLDALAIPQAVIVGHSMGTFVARKVLELAPDRVSRLVLVSGGPRGNTPVMLELQRAVNTLADPVDEGFVREFQMSCIGAPVPEDFVEAAIANSRRMPARVWRGIISGMIEFESALDKPAVRTLVIGGRQDTVFSVPEQIALARLFPRGELHLIDQAGHSLHWEQPNTFVSALLRFGL
jgi:pimeloyl-ACP methyl ester carboxylesterase